MRYKLGTGLRTKRALLATIGVMAASIWAIHPVEATPPPGLPGLELISADPNDWPSFNRDPEGTRWNWAENLLRPDNVGALQVKWTYNTDASVAGTPAVVKNRIYLADLSGTVYALTRDGDLIWRTTLSVPSPFGIKIGGSVLVTNRTIVIADTAGQIHGLDVGTGAVRWTTRPGNAPYFPEGHPFQAIWGAGTMVGSHIAFGVSSAEWIAPLLFPGYPGFTFRGNVILLDPADGHIVWQTFFVEVPTLQSDGRFAPSGATVWGSPAYDRTSHTLFVGTGQNYSEPTTGTSDALIALNASDGTIKWVSQKTAGDHWNFSFLPESPDDPPDADFGDSPQLYRLDGRLVVAAGQKNGFFHVVDAKTGAEVSTPQQFVPGGLLGGFHIESAFAYGVNYAPGNDWPNPLSGNPANGGAVVAINGRGSAALWQFPTISPVISGVAVANGVVYVQELNGLFHALDAISGEELASLFTGGQMSGPAISRGRVYVGTGDVLSLFFNPFGNPTTGSIIAMGLAE